MQPMKRQEDVALSGTSLSESGAEVLEADLRNDPNDEASRLKLLGFLGGRSILDSSLRDRFAKHVVWFLERDPGQEIIGTPWCQVPLPDPAYSPIADAWERVLSRAELAPEVVFNAAKFYSLSDPDRCRDLLTRGEQIAPSRPQWAECLGTDLLRKVNVTRYFEDPRRERGLKPDEVRELAGRALVHLERALALESSRRSRLSILVKCAEAALGAGKPSEALRYADNAIELAAECPDEPHRPDFLHQAHVIRGCVAMESEDLVTARQELHAAGQQGDKRAPVLSSFGPDFHLAWMLLERGEQEVVLAYLDRCAAFWNPTRISRWRAEIERGERPRMIQGYDPLHVDE